MWDTLVAFGPSYCATLAMGAVCAYLGVFCVLGRMVFTGMALAQLSAAGVACAYFLADRWGAAGAVLRGWGALGGGLLASLLGALGLQGEPSRPEVTADGRVGVAYVGGGAVALLLVWQSSQGLSELRELVAGDVLLSGRGALVPLWLGTLVVFGVHSAYRRQLLLVQFDPEFARSLGLRVGWYRSLLMLTLALAVTVSLKAGGVLLVFSFLVLPAAAGLACGEGLTESTLLAMGAAVTSSVSGFVAAIAWDLPVGPAVAVSGVLLVGLCRCARLGVWGWWAARGVVGVGSFVGISLAPLVLMLGSAPAADPGPTGVADPHGHGHGSSPTPAVVREASPREVPGLAEGVESLERGADVATRVAGAQRILEVGRAEGVRPLLEAMADPEPEVREAAERACSLLVTTSQPAFEALGQVLGDDVLELRVYAARVFWRLRVGEGLLVLVDSLGWEDLGPFFKLEVLDVLVAERGEESTPSFDPLGELGEQGPALSDWRRWATRYVQMGGGAVEAAEDPEVVAEESVEPEPEVVVSIEEVGEGLSAEASGVREAARVAAEAYRARHAERAEWERWRGEVALEGVLAEALRSSEPSVRAEVLGAVGRLGVRGLLPEVLEHFTDEALSVREAAREAFRKLTGGEGE